MFRCNPKRIVESELLGKGASGLVFPYRKNPEDNQWVVKISTVKNFSDLMRIMHEIVLGFSCHHPAILPLRAYHVQENKVPNVSKILGYHIYIKMPRMKADLRKIIIKFQNEKIHPTEQDIIKTLYTMASGLEYLHKRSIAHRDIKPENILSDGNGNLKIADIGGGILIGNEDTTIQEEGQNFGTLAYRAPESLQGDGKLKKEQYLKVDIWSLGIMMVELCSHKRIQAHYSQQEINQQLKELEGMYSQDLIKLFSNLLQINPNERISAENIRKILEDLYPKVVNNSDEEHNKISFCDEEDKLEMKKELGKKWDGEFKFDWEGKKLIVTEKDKKK